MAARLPRALRTIALTAAAVATLTALTGCGASEPLPAVSTGAVGEGRTAYPLTIENCGVAVTFAAAPERTVSLDQDSTEILLSLGLEGRMVGTASWTDPVLPSLAEANARVPRLADNAPTYEVLMGAEPDFVTASFGRHFKDGGVVTRDRLSSSGIPSYLSPTDCDNGKSINGGTGQRSTALTVDTLYQEIRELAEIFDVPSRGEALIAGLQRRAAAATAGMDLSGRTVAFWFADTKTPYVGGGRGSTQLLASMTGMTNVYADRVEDWPAVSWESLVEAQPSVLVVGDLQRDRFPGDRLNDKMAFLTGDPLARTIPAVSTNAIIALHGAELNPSIRFVDGLEKIRAWWDAQQGRG